MKPQTLGGMAAALRASFPPPSRGTLTCSYLSHSEQLAFENYQYVDCRGNATLPGGSRPQRSLQRS